MSLLARSFRSAAVAARGGAFPAPFMLRAGLVEQSLSRSGYADPPPQTRH